MRFYVCDLQSGKVLEEIPSLQIEQGLERRLGDYRTGTLTLPVLDEGTPPRWAEILVPWRCLIVVCDDDDRIIWAGIPDDVETSAEPVVSYPCVTLEKYFDRRYMPSAEYVQADQTSEIAYAMARWCGDPVEGIGLDYDTAPSGVLRDRSYHDDEDARILARIQQLSQVINGFEWTVEVEWEDETHTRVRKVFRTGYPTLGRVTEAPDFVFDIITYAPSSVTAFTHVRRWSEGNAATHVMAAGDGEGEDKPYSAPIVDDLREAAGWPRLEERRNFQGVIEDATLRQYAEGMAAKMFGGQEVIEIEANIFEWPTPGDISLGDSVRIDIATDQIRSQTVWRVIGYTLDPQAGLWKPQLARIGALEGEDG